MGWSYTAKVKATGQNRQAVFDGVGVAFDHFVNLGINPVGLTRGADGTITLYTDVAIPDMQLDHLMLNAGVQLGANTVINFTVP